MIDAVNKAKRLICAKYNFYIDLAVKTSKTQSIVYQPFLTEFILKTVHIY